MAWNDPDALIGAIAQYKTQHEQATTALANLEQQRTLLIKSQDTLVGAIAALDQLLQNKQDEEKAAADEMAHIDKLTREVEAA